jgi:hypothetical protein
MKTAAQLHMPFVHVRLPEQRTPSQHGSVDAPQASQLPLVSQAKPSPQVPPPQQGSPLPPQATQSVPALLATV